MSKVCDLSVEEVCKNQYQINHFSWSFCYTIWKSAQVQLNWRQISEGCFQYYWVVKINKIIKGFCQNEWCSFYHHFSEFYWFFGWVWNIQVHQYWLYSLYFIICSWGCLPVLASVSLQCSCVWYTNVNVWSIQLCPFWC